MHLLALGDSKSSPDGLALSGDYARVQTSKVGSIVRRRMGVLTCPPVVGPTAHGERTELVRSGVGHGDEGGSALATVCFWGAAGQKLSRGR
jgi:hypothetical protein